MTVAALVEELRGLGVELIADQGRLRYRAPKGVMAGHLKERLAEQKRAILDYLAGEANTAVNTNAGWFRIEDEAERRRPFPLTDLQQAYWIGESNFYRQSTAAYIHQEYTAPLLDVERLRTAVAELVRRHDALRLAVSEDGWQRVADASATEPVAVHDLRGMAEPDLRRHWARLRREIERRLPSLASGRQLLVEIFRLDDCFRIHLSCRLFAVDGVSLNVINRELMALYRGLELAPVAPVHYRDYVLSITRYRESPAYRRSLAYWQARAAELPAPPDLPRIDDELSGRAEFNRISGRLSGGDFDRFQKNAAHAGVSLNMALCAVFAETLRLWSANRDFSLTVMSAYRPSVHPGLEHLVGNCSTTSVLSALDVGGCLADQAKALSKQLYRDLEHAAVSGVEVTRLLRQAEHVAADRPVMPVVFTSGLGLARNLVGYSISESGWELYHSHLKTPQVWLDHQVYEERGDLAFNWDFVSGVYPPGMVDAMFVRYRARLQQLADDPLAWHAADPVALPVAELSARSAFNSSAAALPAGLLHEFFVRRADDAPERPAIIDGDVCLSYGELMQWAAAIAAMLGEAGVEPGSIVAVGLEKGWRQVAATMGILIAGCAYLPLDSRWPASRIETILHRAGAPARIVGADAGTAAASVASVVDLPFPSMRSGASAHRPPPGDARGIAYVIFTSGSTGEPKGVAISHRAAVNTLQDVIARFGLDARDRVMALSALNFDLSVYDIFATLGVGATLVFPADRGMPDPAAWSQCIERHGITVWNSVPALLDLEIEYLGQRAAKTLAGLRLIMLSGDWIPLPLAERIRRELASTLLVALGGATEAAIWSNYFPVDRVAAAWRSVPYGRPLANQQLHILDHRLEPRPIWATGDLYIGGAGLGEGYVNDPERTAAAFIHRPGDNERLYRTGDLGRYLPDGNIEFLGRSDFQVKLNGFRIELGEVESALAAQSGVRRAVALLTAPAAGRPRLVGFIVAEPGAVLAADTLLATAARVLPSYMMPSSLIELDEIPLSANGKVDRRRLNELAGNAMASATGGPDREIVIDDPVESRLLGLWQRVLGVVGIAPDDEFFRLGGDSLAAVRLVNRIQQEFGIRVELASLFRHGTVRKQALLLGERGGGGAALLTMREGSGGAAVVLVHPVGGNVLCYNALVDRLPAHCPVFGVQTVEPFPASLADMVDRYIDELSRSYPTGALILGGWSMGGVVAWVMAAKLRAAGRRVDLLFCIDSWVGLDGLGVRFSREEAVQGFFRDLLGGVAVADLFDPASPPDPAADDAALIAAAAGRLVARGQLDPEIAPARLAGLFAAYRSNAEALQRHCPERLSGEALLFSAQIKKPEQFPGLVPITDAGRGWLGMAERVCVRELVGDHFTVMSSENLETIAAEIEAVLIEVEA